ncbi:MAG TPA: arginine repressor, partial [Thermoanaerobaculia bacterium]|nr:arginine repressor [Thermoanaerobaculia bacterium]
MPSEHEIRDERHRAILAILRRSSVRSQAALVERLAERGFEVTQSSVSRDLRDLGIAKRGGRYVPPAAPEASPRLLADVAHYVRGVKAAGPNLTVVATQPGTAQAVGLGLDRA